MHELEIKRKYLLDALERPIKALSVYQNEHSRFNPIPRIKRLLRYKERYLYHIGAHLGFFLHTDIHAKTFWGKKLLLPLQDADSFAIYFFGILGGLEYKLIKFLIKNLQPDDIFYDIGANYGFYTFLAQELIQNGEIHAFEPLEGVFAYLERNTQRHERTFLNNLALSEISGSIDFFDGSLGHHSGGSTRLEDVALSDLKKYRRIEVGAITLEDYVQHHKMPTIMKIDTEGGETGVIKGGLEMLSKSHPMVIMEVWNGAKQPISMRAVEVLSGVGYGTIRRISREGELEKITTDNFFTPPFHTLPHDNFVFLKNSTT